MTGFGSAPPNFHPPTRTGDILQKNPYFVSNTGKNLFFRDCFSPLWCHGCLRSLARCLSEHVRLRNVETRERHQNKISWIADLPLSLRDNWKRESTLLSGGRRLVASFVLPISPSPAIVAWRTEPVISICFSNCRKNSGKVQIRWVQGAP